MLRRLRDGIFCTNVFLAQEIRELSQPLGISSIGIRKATCKRTQQVTAPNIVGSCCVRVGSSAQTDATIPSNVGSYSASGEG